MSQRIGLKSNLLLFNQFCLFNCFVLQHTRPWNNFPFSFLSIWYSCWVSCNSIFPTTTSGCGLRCCFQMERQIAIVSTKRKQRAQFKQIPPIPVVTTPPILSTLSRLHNWEVLFGHLKAKVVIDMQVVGYFTWLSIGPSILSPIVGTTFGQNCNNPGKEDRKNKCSLFKNHPEWGLREHDSHFAIFFHFDKGSFQGHL